MTAHDDATDEYATIIQVISDWPVEERLALLRDILRTLTPADSVTRPKNTWEQASGLLAGPWQAPSDADVERLLGESRAEKHG